MFIRISSCAIQENLEIFRKNFKNKYCSFDWKLSYLLDIHLGTVCWKLWYLVLGINYFHSRRTVDLFIFNCYGIGRYGWHIQIIKKYQLTSVEHGAAPIKTTFVLAEQDNSAAANIWCFQNLEIGQCWIFYECLGLGLTLIVRTVYHLYNKCTTKSIWHNITSVNITTHA